MTYAISKVDGDVLLIGGYGAGNVGDEAILRGLLRAANPEINRVSVTTYHPEQTQRIHEDAVPAEIKFTSIEPTPTKLAAALHSHDTILVGGGGIFSAYMGDAAKKIPYFVMMANHLGKETHWTALGVYESTPTWTMKALTRAMNGSSSVSVRDMVSREVLAGRIDQSVTYVPDPATQLKPDHNAASTLLADLGLEGEDVIGMAARSVKPTDIDLFPLFEDIAGNFQENGYEVVLLPFCTHPVERIEQDDRTCRRLAEAGYGSVLDYETPTELLGVVSQLDGLLATRLHSIIFAQVAETPFAAIEYAAKCTSVLDQSGQNERGISLEKCDARSLVKILEDQLGEN